MVDTHAHLTNDFYPQEEIDNLIVSCQQQGVTKVINIGVHVHSSLEGMNLAQKYRGQCFHTIGIHPTEHVAEQVSDLLPYAKNAVAVGECGLEFWDTTTDEEKCRQLELFTQQIELAKDLALPLVLHCRGEEAIVQMLSIIKKYYRVGDVQSGVWHSIAGNQDQAKEMIARGFKLSFNGIVTFKNAQSTRELLENISLTDVLIETDCPFLTPEPFRGKQNSPLFIPYILERIAQIKRVPVSQVEKTTDANAEAVFHL